MATFVPIAGAWYAGTSLPEKVERGGGQVPEGFLGMKQDWTGTPVGKAVGETVDDTTEPDWAMRATAFLGRKAIASPTTPLTVTSRSFGSVPRGYMECKRDQAVSLHLQRMMRRERRCDMVCSLDIDHSPFYSAPAALTDCLDRIAAGHGSERHVRARNGTKSFQVKH
jgi:hypothetical protein